MRYGGRLLTPNAHRCLLDVKRNLRLAWHYLREAVRWQIKEWPLPDKREPWSELKKKMRP